MRMCAIKDIQDGDVLARSIYLSNNRLLLGAGYRITAEIKGKLVEKGYSHVYIMDEGTEDVIPEDVISDELRLEAKLKFEDKLTHIRQLSQFQKMTHEKVVETLQKGNLKEVDLNYELKALVKDIINEIMASKITIMSSIMPKSKDTFFFDHAVNVAVLSILLGRRYRYERSELVSLALGAFLHDIGKVVIEQITGGSDAETAGYYQEHATFGYLLLHNDKNISPLVLQTVNQHHERQDGKGFPIGLKGTNSPPVKTQQQQKGTIFRFAEICNVADGYDRNLLSPMNGELKTPSDVIKEMMQGAGSAYNKNVVETLIEIVPVFPVGSYLKIISIVDPSLVGCFGVVAKQNKNDLKRPVIIVTTNKYHKKIKPIIIDTSKLASIELKLLI